MSSIYTNSDTGFIFHFIDNVTSCSKVYQIGSCRLYFSNTAHTPSLINAQLTELYARQTVLHLHLVQMTSRMEIQTIQSQL